MVSIIKYRLSQCFPPCDEREQTIILVLPMQIGKVDTDDSRIFSADFTE